MANFAMVNSGHNRDDEADKLGMWLFLFTELLLFGGLFLVISDTLARTVIAPSQLPVGVITALLGVPLFLLLLNRAKFKQ